MKNGNGKYKVETGVPIPPKERKRRGYADALRALKKGQCILLPKSKKATTVGVVAAHIFGAGNYAVRSMKDGVRVWRTA